MSTQRKPNQITSGLAVTTFGGLQIEIEGKPLTGLSRKPQALLVYLACESRFHPREVIADMLWDDFTQDRALHNLRVVLSSLRKHARAYLTIDREKAGIKKGVSIWVDASELENMALQIQALGGIRSIGLAREVEQITTVYRGEFLDGFFIRGSRGFEDWLIRERERYHQMTLELHGHLADHFAQGQDFSSAIRHATRMLALDPLYEAGHRQLIGLFSYSGQRNAAIRQYESFHEKLKEEIGVEPHPDTKALYQAIQAGTLESPYQRPAAEIQKSRPEPPFLRPGAVPRTERPLFVGRSPQIDQLATRVRAARDGTGQIAFITGEAGAGKTSLLQAFAFECEQIFPEWQVIFGNCSSIAQTGDPFLPFRQALGMLLGEIENLWQEARLSSKAARRLWTSIPQAVETLLEHGPDLLEVFFQGTDILETLSSIESLELPTWDRIRSTLDPDQISSHERHQPMLINQFTRFMLAFAKKTPLVLILDDLQWADPASIEVLFHLGRQLQHAPLVLIGAYRLDEVRATTPAINHPLEKVFAELKRVYGDVWIDLDAVNAQEGHDFVAAVVNTLSHRLDETFIQTLYRHTQGHPMFTVELLEGMQARGDLVQDSDGHWVQTPTLDFMQVPARVEGLIEERLQRLAPAQRSLLDIATVGGGRFSAQLLARVQNSDVGQTILILSDELGHQHHVVYEDGFESIAGSQHFYYQFQHALIRQYVYGQLANLKKRYLHGQVGEALEALYGTDSEKIAAELAHHFRQAGYPDKAISYSVQAGDRARRIGASDQAIVFYRNALADLAEIEPPPHQPAAYLIQERLGDVYLFHLSGHLQALEHYEDFLAGAQGDEETARGARKLGWVHLLHGNLSKAEALLQQALDNIINLPPSPETNRVYCSLAYLYESTHQLEEARAHATRGLEISNELEDLLGQANAHRELGNVASALGDQQTAFTHDIEALDRYRKLKDLPRIVQGCNNIGESYRRMGQFDTAQVLLNEGLELAQRIGNLGDSALLLVTLAEIQMDQGDWEAAREQLQKALQLAEKSGVVFRSIQANQNLADAYLQLGDLPEARSHLEAVMTLGEKTGHRRYNLRSALTQAALEAREGRIKEALATIEEARSFAGETAADHFVGLSSRVEGEIYRAAGDWEAAVKHLRQSVAHFEAAELPVEIAKTRLDLGQAYRCRDRKGDRARACEALQAAQATYTSINAPAIIEEIEKLLEGLDCEP